MGTANYGEFADGRALATPVVRSIWVVLSNGQRPGNCLSPRLAFHRIQFPDRLRFNGA